VYHMTRIMWAESTKLHHEQQENSMSLMAKALKYFQKWVAESMNFYEKFLKAWIQRNSKCFPNNDMLVRIISWPLRKCIFVLTCPSNFWLFPVEIIFSISQYLCFDSHLLSKSLCIFIINVCWVFINVETSLFVEIHTIWFSDLLIFVRAFLIILIQFCDWLLRLLKCIIYWLGN